MHSRSGSMPGLIKTALAVLPVSLRKRIKGIPGLAGLQRAIVAHALDGREFEHRVDAGPAKGVKFLIRMPEDKGIWTGTYELEFASRLANAVRPGMVAYDIGSWHGFFAGVMAGQGARHVHVFEPLPVNVDRIRRLISLNPDQLITLHSCAVGECDAEMDLLIMSETSMAKLEESTFQVGQTSTSRVRVKVRALDAMIEAGAIEPPSLMKIDVEGAEILVLRGAHQAIRRHRPIIFAEVHSLDLMAQCRSLLESEGYVIETLNRGPADTFAKDVFQIMARP
jgi:FkbM family methyltransferase